MISRMQIRGAVWLAVCLLLILVAVPALPGAPKLAMKVVRVGGDPDYRPMSFSDSSGKMIGYDVEFATKLLAARLGVPVKFEGMAWDGIIPALQAGKIDMLTQLVITDKRKAVVAFSKPYLTQIITSVVQAKRPNFNPGMNDLAGLKVGVQVNTSASAALEKIPNVHPTTYNTVADEFSDLVLGRIDVVAMESLGAGYTTKAVYPGKLRVTGQKLSTTPALIAAAMRKQDTALLAAVNAAITAMLADGTLDKLNAKWFGNLKVTP